jgi:Zn finger protein HypA/HybF involved in hydrogenase expression
METDILVISPCSGSKRYDAVVDTEAIDARPREELVREHPDAVTTAEAMYTGREHQLIRSVVQELGQIATVDWQIISAGFGVLTRDTQIPSYDCTFREIEEVRTRAQRMGLDVESLTNDELVQAVGR